MPSSVIDHLRAELGDMSLTRRVGRIAAISGLRIKVSGLSDVVAVGDRVSFPDARGRSAGGEVVEIDEAGAVVLSESTPDGFSVSHRVLHEGPARLAPCLLYTSDAADE